MRFLRERRQEGHWGRGFYQPKWTSTHYTILDLKNLGISPNNEQIKDKGPMETGTAKIVGREVSPSNTISWVPADGSFPMKHSISGNRFAGAIALLVGSVWVSLFVDDIFKALEPAPLLPDLLMMVFLTLPGIFVLIYGISQYIYHEETTIHQDSITWKRRGVSGQREWQESISNYEGVLKEHQYSDQSDSSRGPSRMIYLIRLLHTDSGKDVMLYRAESSMLISPTDWLEKWKRYAELLQLPVLEQTEGGMSSSDVGGLNEPLINRIRDRKLQVIHIDPSEAKLGLTANLERDEDLWMITCYPVWTAWKSIAGMIVLIVALLGSYAYGLMDPQLFKYLLFSVPVCMIAIGLSIRKHIAHPEQLALDKEFIYYRYRDKRKGSVTEDIPLHSICNISVKSNPMHFRSAADIVIEEENRSIRFGWWLPKKTKLRIKSLLLSLIAKDVIED